MDKSKRYFHYLDFFRVLAAICVLLIHARCEIFNEYSLLNPASQNLSTILFFSSVGFGLEGVMILFVLSGFLVGGRNVEALSKGQITGRQFVINRISRIIPPLLGALLLSSFVKIIRGVELSAWSIVGNILGLQLIVPGVKDEIGVLWTIPYEVWYYVLVLSIIVLFGKKKSYVCGLCLLVLGLCMFIKLEIQYFFLIVIGTIGYFIKDSLPLNKRYLGLVVIGLAITKIVGVLCNSGRAFQGPLANMININLLIFVEGVLLAMLIIRMSISQPHSRMRCLIDSCGRKIAPVSYSLFLTHFSVLELFQHYLGRRADLDIQGLGLFVIESIVCIIVAYVFFLLFEKNTKKVEHALALIVTKVLG